MALESNQALPHDEIAEKALLGAMLIDNRYVNQVFSEISCEDFFRDAHVLIAQAVLHLINNDSVADIITVSSHLEKKKKLQFVGRPRLRHLPGRRHPREPGHQGIHQDRQGPLDPAQDHPGLARHHPEGGGTGRRHHQPAQRDAGRDHQDLRRPHQERLYFHRRHDPRRHGADREDPEGRGEPGPENRLLRA